MRIKRENELDGISQILFKPTHQKFASGFPQQTMVCKFDVYFIQLGESCCFLFQVKMIPGDCAEVSLPIYVASTQQGDLNLVQ